MKKNLFFSFIIFFLSASAILYYVSDYAAHLDLDSFTYDRIGYNFAQTNALIDPWQADVIPIQTVGYPLFLGLLYKFFGHSYGAIVLIQIMVTLFCAFLLYRIGYLLGSAKSGFYAFALTLTNLGFLVFSQFLLTEILLTSIIILWLERFITFFTMQKKITLFTASFIFGFSIIIKPIALFFMPVWSLFLLHWTKLKNVIASLLIFLVPVILYMSFNKATYNQFTIAPVANENIYNYFLPKIVASDRSLTEQEARSIIKSSLLGEKNNEESQVAQKLFISYLQTKPLLVIGIWLQNVLKTFLGLYSSQLKFLIYPQIKGTSTSFFTQKGTLIQKLMNYIKGPLENRYIIVISTIETFWNLVRWIFVILALYLLYQKKSYYIFLFFISFISYCALITGHDGCARYRMMFEPLLIILSALAIDWLITRIKYFIYEQKIMVVGAT